jgi:RimJ/RimL family protein N-acetyltransferase
LTALVVRPTQNDKLQDQWGRHSCLPIGRQECLPHLSIEVGRTTRSHSRPECRMGSLPERNLTTTSGKAFTIRTARPEDAGLLLAYIHCITKEPEFFVLEPDEFPATEEKEREWVQEHLDHPGKIILLAETAGTIIGNVSFENGPYRRIAHRGSLGITVVPQWRGMGVGTALLHALLEWAKTNPLIDKVGLEVFSVNDRAIRLYRKLGFIEEGRRPKDIRLGPGEYVDAVVMHQFVK